MGKRIRKWAEGSGRFSRKRRGETKFHVPTRYKIILGLVLLLLLAGLSLYLWRISEISKEGYVASCLSSAYASLMDLGPAPIRNAVTPVSDWKELSDQATDQLFILAHPRNCNGRNPKPPLLDRWGNRIRIAVREKPSGEIELKVMSNGADGTPNTKDDLIFPHPTPSNEPHRP